MTATSTAYLHTAGRVSSCRSILSNHESSIITVRKGERGEGRGRGERGGRQERGGRGREGETDRQTATDKKGLGGRASSFDLGMYRVLVRCLRAYMHVAVQNINTDVEQSLCTGERTMAAHDHGRKQAVRQAQAKSIVRNGTRRGGGRPDY